MYICIHIHICIYITKILAIMPVVTLYQNCFHSISENTDIYRTTVQCQVPDSYQGNGTVKPRLEFQGQQFRKTKDFL